MTYTLTMQNAREGFPKLLHDVCDGLPQRIDGRMVYECFDAVIELIDAYDSLPTDIGLKLDTANAVDTLLGDLSGHGKIGERTAVQFGEVERLLRADPSTLAAVVTVSDPMYDRALPGGSETVPNLMALQFLYREQALSLHVYLRSCNVMHLTTGLFTMAQLLATMGNVTKSPKLGSVVVHTSSLYVTSSDTGSLTKEYIKPLTVPTPRNPDLPYGLEGGDWESIVERARWLRSTLDGHLDQHLDRLTPSERWMFDQCIGL